METQRPVSIRPLSVCFGIAYQQLWKCFLVWGLLVAAAFSLCFTGDNNYNSSSRKSCRCVAHHLRHKHHLRQPQWQWRQNGQDGFRSDDTKSVDGTGSDIIKYCIVRIINSCDNTNNSDGSYRSETDRRKSKTNLMWRWTFQCYNELINAPAAIISMDKRLSPLIAIWLYYRKKVEVCLRPFFVSWRSRVFHFLMGKLGTKTDCMLFCMKFIG